MSSCTPTMIMMRMITTSLTMLLIVPMSLIRIVTRCSVLFLFSSLVFNLVFASSLLETQFRDRVRNLGFNEALMIWLRMSNQTLDYRNENFNVFVLHCVSIHSSWCRSFHLDTIYVIAQYHITYCMLYLVNFLKTSMLNEYLHLDAYIRTSVLLQTQSFCFLDQQNYRVLNERDICQRQEDDITKISTVLSISKVAASILLRYYCWY